MAKRFTDSDKWKDAWYRKLPPVLKCFWQYLCDECDCAGVWRVDMESATFHIGADLDRDEVLANLGERVVVLPGGDRWHVRKFVEFQYGPIFNEKNKAHRGVMRVLDRFSLPWIEGATKPLDSPYQGPLRGAQEKEKESDKDSISTPEIDLALAAVEASNAQPLVPAASRPLTLGDFQSAHTPTVLIRQLDQDHARSLFTLYGWDCWSAAHAVVAPKARAERRRVYLSEIQDWLTTNAQLEAADYKRAGVPVPKEI